MKYYIILRKIQIFPCIFSHIQCINEKIFSVMLINIGFETCSNIRFSSGNQNLQLIFYFHPFSKANGTNQILGFLAFSILSLGKGRGFHNFLRCRILKCSRSPFYHSVLSKHRKNSSEETTQIHKESDFLHIFSVQLSLIRNLYGVSAVNLRPTAKSRLDIIGIVFISLCGEQILIP